MKEAEDYDFEIVPVKLKLNDTTTVGLITVYRSPSMKCDAEIEPKLRIQMYGHTEEVPLFHPVSLRNLLETYSSVDINYRNVFQKEMRHLRNNKTLFWNLIFFFQMFGLYFDLFVPYKEIKHEISQ